jgi:hypothetical protein
MDDARIEASITCSGSDKYNGWLFKLVELKSVSK